MSLPTRKADPKPLEPPGAIPDHLRPIWAELAPKVRPAIGLVGLESLCGQVYRLRDAEMRVTRDGSVIQDAKGNPSAHPALAIERAAQAEILKWISKYGVRA